MTDQPSLMYDDRPLEAKLAEHLELAGYHRVGNQWAGPDLHFAGRTHERLPQSLTAAAAEVIRHESRSKK